MEASPVRIIQYFDGSKQGLIPLFQRPYSWELRDWKTLWQDVMAQYDPEDRSSHFMGAVVTVPVKSVPVGVSKHLVIDGQQRLTTIAILLCAVRDATSDGPTKGIIGDLLLNRHYETPDDLKLVPTQVDRATFSALVKGENIVQLQDGQMVNAYKYFAAQVAGKDADDNPIDPKQLLQAIQHSLQVVMINLGETDDPYLIFESLNHKGKPLSEADLVRNYVLMRFQHSITTGGEQEKVYQNLWQPMEAALGDRLSDFLRHYGMRHGRNVRKGEIYSAFKADLEKVPTADEVKELLTTLKDSAMSYETFVKPDQAPEGGIADLLRNIQVLDSTVFYPLLIRLFHQWESEILPDDRLLKCIGLLESFYVRRLVCGVPTHGLNKLTMGWCAHLPDADQDIFLAKQMGQGSGSRRCPGDGEFEDSLATAKIYPRRRIARFLLDHLEIDFGHKEAASLEAATMEHIMPQTLSDGWLNALGPQARTVHGKWCDTLGNLTLTAYNPELSNDSFDAKLELFKLSHYELNQWIKDQKSWGAAEIEQRGRTLAQRAVKRWPNPAGVGTGGAGS